MPATTVARPAKHTYVEQIMGLPISVHVRGGRATTVSEAVAEVFAELRRVDAVFSTYRPDSAISRLNRGELDLDACPTEVAEVARLCDVARLRTDGWFDARLPAAGGGTWFDPSGLVKSWAVERAAAGLAGLDVTGWCVNAGGDILAAADVAEPPWRVGVENPFDRSTMLAVLPLRHGGVATSGTSARGAHIVDPHTGQAAEELAAVTVSGPSLAAADIYATAAVARGWAAREWLAGLEGYEAMVVGVDGRIWWTDGWPAPLR